MTELLAAALAIGFFGSLHCIGMCGGLVSALCLSRPKLWWPGLFSYQCGRISSYIVLGLVAGSLGAGLSMTGWFGQIQQLLAWLAGGLMILFALYLGGWLPDPFTRLAAQVTRLTGLSQWMGRAANGKNLGDWLAVGLFNGLLPCGLVYAGLALSLRSADATHGALTMLFFGIGTLPAMLTAPALMHKLAPARRGQILKIAAILLIALGVATLFRSELHQGHDHGENTDHVTHEEHNTADPHHLPDMNAHRQPSTAADSTAPQQAAPANQTESALPNAGTINDQHPTHHQHADHH